RDVQEPVHARRELHERAELRRPDDRALSRLTLRELVDLLLPRVGRERLDRERDAIVTLALALALVDLEHLDVDLVADLRDVLGTHAALPAHLALVHEALDAADVDEEAEVADL